MSQLVAVGKERDICRVPLVRVIIVTDILDRVREEKTERGRRPSGVVCFDTIWSEAVNIHALCTEPYQSAVYCLSFRR
jgi:hypothetical protein